MKTTIKKIIIHLIFLILGFILACCTMDSIFYQPVSVSSQIGAKSLELKSISGDVPTGNVFSSLNSMTLWNVSDSWQRLYNYYTSNSLEYTFEGVQPINVQENIDFATGEKRYALEASFNDFILLNNKRVFSVLFGGLGSYFNVNAVEVGISYDNVSQATYSYGEETNNNYLLYFGYDGFIEIKFIRIYFTGDLSFQPIYNEFLKLYMYGSYNSVGGYPAGFEDGYDIGYQEGYDSAIINNDTSYNNGYNAGYDKALSEGISNPEHVFYTIWSILTTCGDLLYMFFTIPLFGDVTVGFVLIIIPFTFGFIENVIKVIIKLVTMFLGGN